MRVAKTIWFTKSPCYLPVSSRFLLCLLLVVQSSLLVTADELTGDKQQPRKDWPIFLGPEGTGVSPATGLLKKWPAAGPPIVWEKKVGTGYSAPSVRDNKLVIHHRPTGNEEIVDCFDAFTGKTIWQYRYASSFQDPYGYNNGPRCTPLLTDTRCYTFGAEGVLLCLDIKTGEKIWKRETQKEFRVPKHFFGVGCTPILDNNRLYVLVGGQPNSGVVAFSAETGKTLWTSVGKDVWDGVTTDELKTKTYRWTGEEMVVSYSSPYLATIHGKKHLLCLVRQGLVSLDPADGKVRFKYWFRARVHESVQAARPIVIGDRIFISTAYRVGSALLQVNPDGNGYREVWRNRSNMLTHWSTAIEVEGYIYGFSGRHEKGAELRCLDLKTGKVVWGTNGFTGDLDDLTRNSVTGEIKSKKTGQTVPFPFFGRGSKIRVGDQFIILGERGTLALANINPQKYDEVSRTSFKQIHYPAWAAPVLAHQHLYLRCEDAMICLNLKANK